MKRSEYATLNTPASVAIAGKRDAQSPLLAAREDRLGKEHLLRQKSIQQRHARHRGGGHGCHRRGDRHRRAQAAQASHIPRAGFVIDDARRHEQRRLEGRVIHHVENGRHQCQLAVHAEQQRDEPEVADGRVREHSFHVALKDRRERAEQQRCAGRRRKESRTTAQCPRSAGQSRASRNTPALTIVAECR